MFRPDYMRNEEESNLNCKNTGATVLKGAPRWTLKREKGRNRAQGCVQMDPCASGSS